MLTPGLFLCCVIWSLTHKSCGPFYISEKSEPFYDEFIEKQLLAGNIPSRHLGITLVSFTATLPAADHGKMMPGPPLVNTSSNTELHAVSSQLSLQSIQDVSIIAQDVTHTSRYDY